MRNEIFWIGEDARFWSLMGDQSDFLEKVVLTYLLNFIGFRPVVSFSVLLTNDATLCELNSRFRAQNKPTNILSFPFFDEGEVMQSWTDYSASLYLGDLAFSFDTLKEEADILKKEAIGHDSDLKSTFFDSCSQKKAAVSASNLEDLQDVSSCIKMRDDTLGHAESRFCQNHFTHLFVHGVLHLLGYEHEAEDEALLMESKERDVLNYFGIPDPYINTT